MINDRKNIISDSARSVDDNGYMRVVGNHITKEAVNDYLGEQIPGWQELGLIPDKIYKVYRPGDELEKSVDLWNGIPLLLEHYIDSASNPQKDARVGSIGTDASWSSPYIDVTLSVWDDDAKQAIESGTYRELSCAYAFTPELKSGTFNGQPYDIVMRDIRPNHVALVQEGRAGPDVLVADEALPTEKNDMKKKHVQDEEDMTKREETAENEFGIRNPLLKRLYALIDKEDDTELADYIKSLDDREAREVEREVEDEDDYEGRRGEKDGVRMNPNEQDRDRDRVMDEDDDEEEKKPAMDSKRGRGRPRGAKNKIDVDAVVADAKAESMNHFKRLSNAARKARPILGDVNPFDFVSDSAIYAKALEIRGYNVKSYAPSAYEGMLDVILAQDEKATPSFAVDSAISKEDLHPAFANVAAIKVRHI